MGRREIAMHAYDTIELRSKYEGKPAAISIDLAQKFGTEHMIAIASAFDKNLKLPFFDVIYSAPIISKESIVQFQQVAKNLEDIGVRLEDLTAVSSDTAGDVVGSNSGVVAIINKENGSGWTASAQCDLHALQRDFQVSCTSAFGPHDVQAQYHVIQLIYLVSTAINDTRERFLRFVSDLHKNNKIDDELFEFLSKHIRQAMFGRWWTVLAGSRFAIKAKYNRFTIYNRI